ncbi:MAG: hypothetical protein O3B73_14745 [bacterium]|jgi:uncharacterized protein YjlB|nr:hypothetical protein [bacterium]
MDAVQNVGVIPHYLVDDGIVPNSPLPLLVYPGAVDLTQGDPARTLEQVFASNTWDRSWRNGVYSFHHYHSTAHEVLGIARGHVKVQMGGAAGVIFSIQAGDVMAIPAGVGHKNLGASADLLVIGAYPPGPDWDLCRESESEYRQGLVNIPRVPCPAADPVYGQGGPMRTFWATQST